jgi:DnaJ-class molecular chaperone
VRHPCPDCHGTGRDEKKTVALAKKDGEFKHRVKHHGTYVMCWTCNGSGADAAEYFRWSDPVTSTSSTCSRTTI